MHFIFYLRPFGVSKIKIMLFQETRIDECSDCEVKVVFVFIPIYLSIYIYIYIYKTKNLSQSIFKNCLKPSNKTSLFIDSKSKFIIHNQRSFF